MAEKPYKQQDESENYQPQREKEDVSYEYDDDSMKKSAQKLPSKRAIVIIVVALVVIAIVYKAISMVISHYRKVPSPMSTQTKVIKPPVHALPLAVNKQAAVNPLIDRQTVNAKQNRAVLNQLTRTQQQIAKHLSTLTQSMSTIDASINALQQSLQNLSDKLDAISVAKKQMVQQKHAIQAKLDAKIRAKVNYYVQAIIPGRAWLKSVNGSGITVTAGDTIRGYGKVLMIDPYSGNVTTSSGAVIAYGNDQS